MANSLYDALIAPHVGRDTPFLHLPDGSTTTHAAFMDQVARNANALAALGLNQGDRLAVHIQKSPEALALYAGCIQAGVVFLPLNTAYTAKELKYFVGDSEAALFICDPAEAHDLEDIAVANSCQMRTLGADGAGSFAGVMTESGVWAV